MRKFKSDKMDSRSGNYSHRIYSLNFGNTITCFSKDYQNKKDGVIKK
jgi:hypothetical protein